MPRTDGSFIVIFVLALLATGSARASEREGSADPPSPDQAPIVDVALDEVEILHKVEPEYPRHAQRLNDRARSDTMTGRTSGTVVLEVLVAVDGSVESVRVARSLPLLDQAALTAVQKWRFAPTLRNGAPARVRLSVPVTFKLVPQWIEIGSSRQVRHRAPAREPGRAR